MSKWQFIDSLSFPDKPCPLINLDLANCTLSKHTGVWKHNPRDLGRVLSWQQNYFLGHSRLVKCVYKLIALLRVNKMVWDIWTEISLKKDWWSKITHVQLNRKYNKTKMMLSFWIRKLKLEMSKVLFSLCVAKLVPSAKSSDS